MSFSYVLRRLLQAVPTVLGILVVTFVLIQMAPGDAADNDYAPGRSGASPGRCGRGVV